jgi:hypothetical protein
MSRGIHGERPVMAGGGITAIHLRGGVMQGDGEVMHRCHWDEGVEEVAEEVLASQAPDMGLATQDGPQCSHAVRYCMDVVSIAHVVVKGGRGSRGPRVVVQFAGVQGHDAFA